MRSFLSYNITEQSVLYHIYCTAHSLKMQPGGTMKTGTTWRDIWKMDIHIDNNLAENAIRPVTLGRKNYQFCGNHEAAVSKSVVCSLLATSKAHEVNSREYLNDVIAKMPYMQKTSYDELLQLLPHKWETDK